MCDVHKYIYNYRGRILIKFTKLVIINIKETGKQKYSILTILFYILK